MQLKLSSVLFQIASMGLQAKSEPTTTMALQRTESTIDPQMIHDMVLPSCSRSSDRPMLTLRKAIEKPLISRAKLENLDAVILSDISSFADDFP